MTRSIAIISCLFAVLFLSLGSEEGGDIPDFGCVADSDVECVLSQPSFSKFKGFVNSRVRRPNLSGQQHSAVAYWKSVAFAPGCRYLPVRLMASVLSVRMQLHPVRILYCVFRE